MESKYYSVFEIAALLSLSASKVRELFLAEPGVLVIGDRTGNSHKRPYRTIRVPASVLDRVLSSLSTTQTTHTTNQLTVSD